MLGCMLNFLVMVPAIAIWKTFSFPKQCFIHNIRCIPYDMWFDSMLLRDEHMKLLEYFIWFRSTQIPLLYTIFANILFPLVNVAIVVVW